jgi:hypothetical protein
MDPQVLEQRIRNRLFEYVVWVQGYERESEPRLGLGELHNQWEDFLTRPICEANFPAPAFTVNQIRTLKRLDDVWELLCSATPKHITNDSEVFDERVGSVRRVCRRSSQGLPHQGQAFGRRPDLESSLTTRPSGRRTVAA